MTLGRVIVGVGAAAVVYSRWVRARLVRWGATDEEVSGPFPGAELLPDAERSGAMAVTIDAPPDQVWPWLVQLGGDRGGWYSWDLLDNAGRPSARSVHPEWQDLAVGDSVKYWTRLHGPVDAWEVAALEPHRFLALRVRSDLRGRPLDPQRPFPRAWTGGLWAFLLDELPGRRARLVISGYQVMYPRWLGRLVFYWVFPPVVWFFQARMLAVLKRNIEGATTSAATAPLESLPAGVAAGTGSQAGSPPIEAS